MLKKVPHDTCGFTPPVGNPEGFRDPKTIQRIHCIGCLCCWLFKKWSAQRLLRVVAVEEKIKTSALDKMSAGNWLAPRPIWRSGL